MARKQRFRFEEGSIAINKSDPVPALVLRRVRDGAELLKYSNTDIDMWRAGTTFVRPKWGIYRSLKHADALRDEAVRFNDFCLAKRQDDCVR